VPCSVAGSNPPQKSAPLPYRGAGSNAPVWLVTLFLRQKSAPLPYTFAGSNPPVWLVIFLRQRSVSLFYRVVGSNPRCWLDIRFLATEGCWFESPALVSINFPATQDRALLLYRIVSSNPAGLVSHYIVICTRVTNWWGVCVGGGVIKPKQTEKKDRQNALTDHTHRPIPAHTL
jgi:hypothetical protein